MDPTDLRRARKEAYFAAKRASGDLVVIKRRRRRADEDESTEPVPVAVIDTLHRT